MTPEDRDDWIEDGRRRLIAPAAMFIAVAVVLVGVAGVMGVLVGVMSGQFAKMQEIQGQQFDADPKLTPAQKTQIKQALRQTYQGMGVAYLAVGVVNLIAAVVIGHGAYKMLAVSGRGWAVAAAVVAVVPCCTGYAWVVGLPAGIWALIVLNQPDVKAAFRAARRERELDLGLDPE